MISSRGIKLSKSLARANPSPPLLPLPHKMMSDFIFCDTTNCAMQFAAFSIIRKGGMFSCVFAIFSSSDGLLNTFSILLLQHHFIAYHFMIFNLLEAFCKILQRQFRFFFTFYIKNNFATIHH